MANFKEMLDSQKPIKIELSREIELDELYSKLSPKSSEFKNEFELKKGLFGKKIQFKKDAETDLIITVTVKGNVITVKPVIQENKTSVGTGGIEFRVDKNSILRKGVSGVMDIPIQRGNYLKEVANTIKNILGV